jgi:hypothetical protein
MWKWAIGILILLIVWRKFVSPSSELPLIPQTMTPGDNNNINTNVAGICEPCTGTGISGIVPSHIMFPVDPPPIQIQKKTPVAAVSPPPQTILQRIIAPLPWLTDTLQNRAMTPGQSLKSKNGLYRFAFQTDGNLVVYNLQNKALWNSGTYTKPAVNLEMQPGGNLVLYDAARNPLWATWTSVPNSYLILQNDGNLVLYSPDGKSQWDSETWAGSASNPAPVRSAPAAPIRPVSAIVPYQPIASRPAPRLPNYTRFASYVGGRIQMGSIGVGGRYTPLPGAKCLPKTGINYTA